MDYINLLQCDDYPAFLRLYTEAFPAAERRPYADCRQLGDFIMSKGKFRVISVKEDADTFVGFLTYWTFEKFVYVEHFAVAEEYRGRNIGSGMIRHLFNAAGENVLLEVERPETQEARRRVKFYERLGFKARTETDYMQPPYSPALPGVPLLLMTHGNVDLSEPAKALAPLFKEVYGCDYSGR